MTKDSSYLCVVVMRDVIELHRARQGLAALHDGISQTNLSGKPAMLAILNQIDDVCCTLIKKSASRAIANGLKGHYQRYDIPQELIEYMAGFAKEPPTNQIHKKRVRKPNKFVRPAESPFNEEVQS